MQRHVVARSAESSTSAEYGVVMLTSVQRAEDAVNDVAIDRQHSTVQSRKCDVLAAKAPMKLRHVAERASSVSRQDPRALLDILKKDPYETALQDAYDAVHSTSVAVCQWLGYNPIKRAYYFSTGATAATNNHNNNGGHHHHQTQHHHAAGRILMAQPQHLSNKYTTKISEGFKDCELAVRALDELRGRLPTTARLVRFASRTELWQQRQLSSRQPSGPVSPTNSTGSLEDYYDDNSRYGVDQIDDFLTEAAPLGVGVETSEVFACRDKKGDLFMTWNFRVAEELLDQVDDDDDLCGAEDDDDEDGERDDAATAGDEDLRDLRERRSIDSASPTRDLERPVMIERYSSTSAVDSANRQTGFLPIRTPHQSASGPSSDPPPLATRKKRRPGPAVLAHTTIYKSIERAEQLALDDGDEIWAVMIDGREYYYCVMEDGGDRGIQYALSRLNLDEEACARFGVTFKKVQDPQENLTE